MAPKKKRCVRRGSSVREVNTSQSIGPIQAETSVPVDCMDTHDPDVERDTPFDASSAETHASSSTRRPRGPSVGKGTQALVEKMCKVPISIHRAYGRPVDPVQSAKLSSFAGTYVRREMHLRPTFADGGKDAISEGLERAQKRCAKNKANRASLKWGHTTGSRSFVARRHTLCDEETGTERDLIDLFRDKRCKDAVWVNQAAEETHAQMEELRQRNTQENGTQAMPSAYIVENVLGYRPGYVKGLGHEPKPTCSGSTTHCTGRTSMDNKIQAKLDELAAKNKKLEENYMRREQEISELRTFLRTICVQQGWDAPPFVMGTGPGTSLTTSQPHDPSHQPSCP